MLILCALTLREIRGARFPCEALSPLMAKIKRKLRSWLKDLAKIGEIVAARRDQNEASVLTKVFN